MQRTALALLALTAVACAGADAPQPHHIDFNPWSWIPTTRNKSPSIMDYFFPPSRTPKQSSLDPPADRQPPTTVDDLTTVDERVTTTARRTHTKNKVTIPTAKLTTTTQPKTKKSSHKHIATDTTVETRTTPPVKTETTQTTNVVTTTTAKPPKRYTIRTVRTTVTPPAPETESTVNANSDSTETVPAVETTTSSEVVKDAAAVTTTVDRSTEATSIGTESTPLTDTTAEPVDSREGYLPLRDKPQQNHVKINEQTNKEFQVLQGVCGVGKYTGGTVGFRLREGAHPIFLRARPLAYALREPVERALEQLQRDGVISPVSSSDWATPIVPVMKKDGTIRICGDFKLTLNKCLEIDRFPLPRVEDLLAKLHGGDKFSKIDLSQAYTQFELDESQKFTVINTHKGLFKYNRLIFGLASSPGIFQRKMEQIFAGLPGVGVFLDDIIITGKDDASHLATLKEVFARLEKWRLRVRKDKCTFFGNSVTYLGFVIDKNGVHTDPHKVEAIKKVKTPTNVSDLRSFLGLVIYYAKFVPNMSTMLSPLYNLLKKDSRFRWDQRCERAFNDVKNILASSEVLVHYSLDLPLILTTDASSFGIGAVISHITSQGERRIAFASRTLNSAEKNYSQIEREALSIIFGVRKFHQYLYGRKFFLRTDHKPLVTIFGDKAGIPVMAASRMQRWAVILGGYDYKIEYVSSKNNAADALSRLPVSLQVSVKQENTYLSFVQSFLPVTRKEMQEQVSLDSNLRRVMSYLHSGWPDSCPDSELRPYFARRNELYIDMGCVVWGYRLVIPASLRSYMLSELHVGHMGVVKMKSIARSFVWWPGIDADIERVCRECATCIAESPAPPKAAIQPWPHEPEPWSRLHVDFLGPLKGKTFLVIIDATSKWLEVFHMPRTNASAVIKVLRETFARFGLPKQVVSDNGPPFSSREYLEFMAKNGVKISFSAIYHPASNGAAEGAVRICKRALKKSARDGCHLDAALQAYLLAYRNVEHSTTGVSPAMLLQRRSLRTRLDHLRWGRPIEDKVRVAQEKQIESAGGQARAVQVGQDVMVRNYAQGEKWVHGRVEEGVGSRHYVVNTGLGQLKRHVNQIKPWAVPYEPPDSHTPGTSSGACSHPAAGESGAPVLVGPPPLTDSPVATDPPPAVPPVRLHRPKRLTRPIDRWGY